MDTTYDTREAWLNAAVVAMRPWFAETASEVPVIVRVSTGWSRGAKPNSIGWCWKSTVAGDLGSNIFISPELADPLDVLAVLLHELCHAADDCQSKHGGQFRRLWKFHGFTAKPTQSVPGEELTERLEELAKTLGPYPHSKMTPGMTTKPQGTRMVKIHHDAATGGCGYTLRTTRRWLDEYGTPYCPCVDDGDRMTEA